MRPERGLEEPIARGHLLLAAFVDAVGRPLHHPREDLRLERGSPAVDPLPGHCVGQRRRELGLIHTRQAGEPEQRRLVVYPGALARADVPVLHRVVA